MIELAFLALLNRLSNWGLTPLIATRTVAADRAALHRFLSDPANQLHLAGHPRKTATYVRPSTSARVISAELERAGRPLLWLTWILSPARGTTEVDLTIQFQTRGPATRLALMLGGRRRLARRADQALATLAHIYARTAEDVIPAPAPAGAGRPGSSARGTRPIRHAHRPRPRVG